MWVKKGIGGGKSLLLLIENLQDIISSLLLISSFKQLSET
jgi:hypothetical protein